VQQAVYNEQAKGVVPINQEYGSEQVAQFGNEQTDVAQFFKVNQSAFFNDQRHNAYVPNVNSWNEQGNTMHSTHLNEPRTELAAANNDAFRKFSMY
jgi:hypothetical protein